MQAPKPRRVVEETCSDISRMQWSFNYVSGPATGPTTSAPPAGSGHQMDNLDRGVVSVHSSSGNLVSGRLLGTEALSVPSGGTTSGTA